MNNMNTTYKQPLVENKCEICNKKIGFLCTVCKCGRKLCKNHVFPSNHACDFDYKSEGKLLLKKTLIPVHPTKINKL